MLNENAKKWVVALRSGKYKQGCFTLRSIDDKYCCLGVACDIAIQNGVSVSVHRDEVHGRYEYDDSGAGLPVTVMDWLGLTTQTGFYNKHDGLIRDNDSLHLSFKRIADIIESKPEGLFNV
jgi:hypothetical protein